MQEADPQKIFELLKVSALKQPAMPPRAVGARTPLRTRRRRQHIFSLPLARFSPPGELRICQHGVAHLDTR